MKIHTEHLAYDGHNEDGEPLVSFCGEDTIDLADTIFDPESPSLIGDIYRHSQSEHGRCTGRVYIDTKSRGTIAIGWVFIKRRMYDDSPDTYLGETWVTLLDKDETVRTIEYHAI